MRSGNKDSKYIQNPIACIQIGLNIQTDNIMCVNDIYMVAIDILLFKFLISYNTN